MLGQAVDVFVGRDGVENFNSLRLVWQWDLNDDAMHTIVSAEPFEQCERFGLFDSMNVNVYEDIRAICLLKLHVAIDDGIGVGTDNGQFGRDAVRLPETAYAAGLP